MERLTKRSDFTGLVLIDGKGYGEAYFGAKEDYDRITKALNKLAAYEDTEEQGRLVVLPEPTPDIDFMRIFNLIMADAEDRVIVLPVKVNEEVFYLTPYAEEKIQALPVIQFIIDDKGLSFLAVNDAYGSNFTINDIGKRAFLTRKEAEAALKGDGAQ